MTTAKPQNYKHSQSLPIPPNPSRRPNIGLYLAESLAECKIPISALEGHFRQHPIYYNTEERKVQQGEAHLDAKALPRWEARRRALSGPSWTEFVLFLAEQLAVNHAVEVARSSYTNTYQRNEAVLSFALVFAAIGFQGLSKG